MPTRRGHRHFRRSLLPHGLFALNRHGTLATPPDASTRPVLEAQALRSALNLAAQAPIDELLRSLGSSAQGLSARQASLIRRRVGPNIVSHERAPPWWLHLWHCYRDPFNLLLSALAVVSALTASPGSAAVILSMVVLATGLRFVQELRAGRAADALKAWVAHHTTVRRAQAAAPVKLPSSRLVPGDIILLAAGDMIPADCRLIETDDLIVSQSALTGESLPVEKQVTEPVAVADPMQARNLVLTGCTVVSGTATAVVVATAERTLFGLLTRHAASATEALSAFQISVRHVGRLLVTLVLIMVPAVFLINLLTKGDALQAALFALAVGVGLTPEMLPMVVTSTLARGALLLSRHKVIVKRLDAIHDLGAMTVLCTDKTGTLTQDRLTLDHWVDAQGQASPRVLHLARLNSHYQTGLRNPMDTAILARSTARAGSTSPSSPTDALDLTDLNAFSKLDEAPFDFQRRRMSVLIAWPDKACAQGSEQEALQRALQGSAQSPVVRPLLITKGAVDELLQVCTQVRRGDQAELLDEAMRADILQLMRPYDERGQRVIAVATRVFAADLTVCHAADEHDLVLEGFLVFQDPPRPSSAPALQELQAHGVTVKVLTGDNPRVTAHLCAQVGLNGGLVCTGPEVDRMDDSRLMIAVHEHQVFAQLSPLHKERIVQALRARGEVVGFLGDGINDAPALHAANIGISVHSAVDIARESADVVLLEKSLRVVGRGVIEGRRTIANLHKYIRMAASSNFGNVLSILLASMVLPFLPMLPVHLLLQNLIYDVSQSAVPFDTVDADELSRPNRWQPTALLPFMLWFGPLSSVFDALTFAVLWFVFGANQPEAQTLFQSGWFVVGLLTQTLVVHSLRTARVPFVQSQAAPALQVASLGVLCMAVFIPLGPFAGLLQLQAPPAGLWIFLPVVLVAYLVAAQGLKAVFIRRHGWV